MAGAETMVENLTYGLAAEGHDVLVISLFDLHTAITERIENKGIKIEYLGKKRGFDPSIISKMRKIIKAYQPDVIHTHRYVCRMPFWLHWGLRPNGCIRCTTLLRKNRQKLEKALIGYYSAIFNVVPVALVKKSKNDSRSVWIARQQNTSCI